MNFIFVIALLLLASLTAATAAATAAAFQAEEEWTQLRTNNRQAQDTMMGGATAATAVNTNNNNTSTGGCSVCSRLGSSVVPYTLPWGKELLVTCGEYEQKITETVPSDSPECSTSQDTLEYRCCKQAPSMLQGYECESNVRSFVLNDSYDATVAPLHSVNGTTSAVEVTTHFSYFNVKELDVKTSTLEIFVMVLLQWNDPRLAWDRDSSDNSTGTNDNCATRINVRADYSIEETEIWVPSLDLVNRASSFQDFPPERAEVRPDGTVTWRRLGSLRAICAFVGLRRIPFDDVGCRLVFMNYDFTPVNFKLLDTGNNRTRGFDYWDVLEVSYSEFTLVNEKTKTAYSTISPGLFEIDLFFHRARTHYILFTILPNVLFTYVSFGQFSFGITDGDRISFSITVVLIIVTQSILTASLLPVCSEMLWLNAFNLVSMLFTLVGVLESLLIFLLFKLVVSKKETRNENEDKEKEEGGGGEEEYKNLIPRNRNVDEGDDEDEEESGNNLNDDREEVEGMENSTDSKGNSSLLNDFFSSNAASETNHTETEGNRKSSSTGQQGTSDDKKRNFSVKKFNTKIVRTFTTKPDGVEDVMERLDFLCASLFPLAYTIYIIVMFTSNDKWEEDPAERWKDV